MNSETYPFRLMKDDEKQMLRHSSMHGPNSFITKLKSGRWGWSFRGIRSPTLYPTKREASQRLEKYLDVLRELAGMEAQARTVSELLAGRFAGDRQALEDHVRVQLDCPIDQAREVVDIALERAAQLS